MISLYKKDWKESDLNTKQGFLGYLRGKNVIIDKTNTVSDDECWTFIKKKFDDHTVYELV